MTTVVIIDYGSGNLHSAAKAFERAARESGSGHSIVVAADPDAVRGAESTKRILTSDFPPLKPYFHGTTSRIGAPF